MFIEHMAMLNILKKKLHSSTFLNVKAFPLLSLQHWLYCGKQQKELN